MLKYLHDKPEEQDIGRIAGLEEEEGAPDRLGLGLCRQPYEAIVVAGKRAALQVKDTLH